MKKTKICATVCLICMLLMCCAALAEAEAPVQIAPVMIDLSGLVQAVISVAALLIARKLIPWIKSKTTVEQQVSLGIMVRTLVFAAEQIYGGGNGAEKMDYVKREMEARGYTFDRAVIEAEVKKMSTEVLGAVSAKEGN